MESLSDTLMERVNMLIQPSNSLQWGDPLLLATPTAVAIQELAVRTEALENAVREIAQEVQKLAGLGVVGERKTGD